MCSNSWLLGVYVFVDIRIRWHVDTTSHEQNPSRHLWKFSRDIVFKTPLKTPFQDTSVLKRRLEKKVRCLGEPSWKKRSIFKTVHQDAFSRRLFKTPFKTTFQDTYVSWKNRVCLDIIFGLLKITIRYLEKLYISWKITMCLDCIYGLLKIK